jgi:Fe2+ transport system protein B
MVNEEILGGLRSALNRGESLKKAMMSFYDAGYKKEDIEAAARALQENNFSQSIQQTQPIRQHVQQAKKIQQAQKIQQIQPKTEPIMQQPIRTVQRVSNYEQENFKPGREWLLFVMIALLLVLVGILTAVFLFKAELTEFFNKLFS